MLDDIGFTREELVLIRSILRHDSSGTHGSDYAKSVDKLIRKVTIEIGKCISC